MSNVKSTTQNHLDIADIKNNIVVLTSGGACAILETTAINFDLLSMQEQDAAIASFSSLLNSLTFPMQITIRSKQIDISEYLEKVKEHADKQFNQKIKDQINAYRAYIEEELVTKEEVLDKSFYVTIPYKLFTLGVTSDSMEWVNNLLGINSQPKQKGKVNVDNILHEAQGDLAPKVSFLIKEFSRIGIKARQLKSSEIIKLFYDMYNSETAKSQKLKQDVTDYTAVLVEPKIS